MCLTIGWKAYLLIQLPTMFLAGVVGVWLFYVQHQFEGVDGRATRNGISRPAPWKAVRSTSSRGVLQWITGSIGYHHIHHLSPKIPNYYLEKCYKENAIFQDVKLITLRSSLKSLTFRLWDEELHQLVGYSGVKAYCARHGISRGKNAPQAT